MNLLDRIIESKRLEVSALRARAGDLRTAAERAVSADSTISGERVAADGLEGVEGEPLAESAADGGGSRPFASALRGGNVSVIAECKRRSPSAGNLRSGLEPAMMAREYARGGAAALSVLTDSRFFGGSLADLRAARAAVALPVLRKDFLIDRVQLWESRVGGADAVLLIVRILEDERLGELLALAAELRLAALVEVHDEGEIQRALGAGAEIIGVNSRDLSTFRTNLGVIERLAGYIPADCLLVAESGIGSRADVVRVAKAGADAVLVGEHLVRSGDPAAGALALADVPRHERATGTARAAENG